MRKIIKVGSVIVVAFIALIVVVAIATGGKSKHVADMTPAPSRTGTVSPAPVATPTIQSWYNSGGGSQHVAAIEVDLAKIQNDATTFAGDPTNMTYMDLFATDGAQLSKDAQATESNWSESGAGATNMQFSNDLVGALGEYADAGSSFAALPQQAGNVEGELTLVETGNSAMQTGNSDLKAATALLP